MALIMQWRILGSLGEKNAILPSWKTLQKKTGNIYPLHTTMCFVLVLWHRCKSLKWCHLYHSELYFGMASDGFQSTNPKINLHIPKHEHLTQTLKVSKTHVTCPLQTIVISRFHVNVFGGVYTGIVVGGVSHPITKPYAFIGLASSRPNSSCSRLWLCRENMMENVSSGKKTQFYPPHFGVD